MSLLTRTFLAVVLTVLAAGCADKMTTQQALVEEAFQACRAQGPSARLERVDRDGRFSVVGREGEAQRVHDCMQRYAEPTRRQPPGVTPPLAVATPAPRPETLVGGRLPGTWRGTLRLPSRAAGEADVTSPATVRFLVAAGTLRWTLAAGQPTPSVAADGTAVVVDGELRMTGTIRSPAARAASLDPPRSTVTVRYAGTMVGDRLEVTGVTTDRQKHVLSIRRVAE
jgi:hypothetical protein